MTHKIPEHICISASPRLEKHLAVPQEERMQGDHWFHMLMALIVDEAAKNAEFYMPAIGDKPAVPTFLYNNCPVMLLYTDEEAAKAMAAGCNALSHGNDENAVLEPVHAVRISLANVLETVMGGSGIAFNPGLPEQIALPPNVTHTAYHLYLTVGLGMKETNPAYQPWASLVRDCLWEEDPLIILNQRIPKEDQLLSIELTETAPMKYRIEC